MNEVMQLSAHMMHDGSVFRFRPSESDDYGPVRTLGNWE